jgi:hypothetical protein
VEGAYVRLIDLATGKETCKFKLKEFANVNGMAMAGLYRLENNTWVMQAIGEQAPGQTVQNSLPYLTPFLKPSLTLRIHVIKGVNLASKNRDGEQTKESVDLGEVDKSDNKGLLVSFFFFEKKERVMAI